MNKYINFKKLLKITAVFGVLGLVSFADAEVETNSITVCKIIIDQNDNVTDGALKPGETFTVSHTGLGTGKTTFTTPLNLNTDIIGDTSNDAECVLYDNLDPVIYYYEYEEEVVSGSLDWLSPLYNDQLETEIGSILDFFTFGQNADSNGIINFASKGPKRTLVVLNQFNSVCGNNVLETGEQCDDSNTDNKDGCSSTCQLETVTCGDLEDKTGWYSEYFNYFSSHIDMNLDSSLWPDTGHGDPLTAFTTDWYDNTYFKFARIDSNLLFGADFFPFDMAKEEDTNGHDYHFGSHFSSKVENTGTVDYAYTLTSDDDVWVYVNGVLMIDNAGIHPPVTQTGTLSLTQGDIVDVFFAERHTTQSNLSFSIDGAELSPYREDCVEKGSLTVCKIIIDEEGNVTDGSDRQASFTLPGVAIAGDPTMSDTVFITPLDLNVDLLFNDGVNDAQCIIYDNLELGAYHYGQETIIGQGWEIPLYNDQYDHPVDDLTDFFPYGDPGNVNSDGYVGVSLPSWLSRTVVVLNQYASSAENQKPVITLTGSDYIEINKGDSFPDEGATADDPEDGDITSDIVVGGETVDNSAPDTYVITYDVIDSEGLAADQVTRTVVVNETGGGGGGGVIFISSPEIVITNEKVVDNEDGTALVTWNTNSPATSQVVYGLDSLNTLTNSSDNYGYASGTVETNVLTKSHAILVSGLVSTSVYYFRPVADNSASPEKVGQEVTYTKEKLVITCTYLLEYLKMGEENNPTEVIKLQDFLRENEGCSLVSTGMFDQATFDAVSEFQLNYQDDVLIPWGLEGATGYVYITTKRKINELYCQRPFPLTTDQQAEIANYNYLLEYQPEELEDYGPVGLIQPEEPEEFVLAPEEEPLEPELVTTPTSEDTELVIDETGLLAQIDNTDNEEDLKTEDLGGLALAGVGSILDTKIIYWLALILVLLILISVMIFFRAKRKSKVIITAPPTNIPLR